MTRAVSSSKRRTKFIGRAVSREFILGRWFSKSSRPSVRCSSSAFVLVQLARATVFAAVMRVCDLLLNCCLGHRCFADVYLAGTVMLIFGMGLYGLFISNTSSDVPSDSDRALKGSSLFGMFALKVAPLLRLETFFTSFS